MMLPLHCASRPVVPVQVWCATGRRSISTEKSKLPLFLKGSSADAGLLRSGLASKTVSYWSFLGGSRVLVQPPRPKSTTLSRKSNKHVASCNLTHIGSNAFTFGTVAVLPFYTLMVLAPNAELTKRSMQSSVPYVILGLLYAYLLYLSWTPDTIRLMFASKYWLPELPGIARMFSNEMTLASAWIHLLVVDLFAARQIFHDGLKNGIETRHSVSLCLLFCPIGIVTHAVTKLLTKRNNCQM